MRRGFYDQAPLMTLPACGPTAQAIGYALNHWDGLARILDDGRAELDTNTVERHSARGLVQKECPVRRQRRGRRSWAAVASLVETCQLNGAEPQCYLADTLTRLVNGWPQARIDEVMAQNWTTAASP